MKPALPLPRDGSQVILTEHLIFGQRNRTVGRLYARMWPTLRVCPGAEILVLVGVEDHQGESLPRASPRWARGSRHSRVP